MDGLTWSGFGGLTVTGAATLSSAAVSINSNAGNISFGSTLSGGSQDLTIAVGTAAGTTTFTGAVSGVGDGVGAALTINSTGLVRFRGAVSGNNGIISSGGGNTRFDASVSLLNGNTGSSFAGGVTFGSGISWTGSDGLSITGAVSALGSISFSVADGAITMTSALNDFTGTVDLANTGGLNVGITDATGLTLGTLSITGALTALARGALNLGQGSIEGVLTANSFSGGGVTASGAITQSGALTVTGASFLTAGANAITLTQANNFVGAVTLGTGATEVQITDVDALTLVSFGTITGNLTAISSGALNLGTGTVGGALSATSGNGNITQAGVLTVGGITTLTAGTGNITLALANNFNEVVINSGGVVQLVDAGAITMGTITTSGNFTLTSGGTTNLNGAAAVGGSYTANVTGAANINAKIVAVGSVLIDATGALTINVNPQSTTGSVTLIGGAGTGDDRSQSRS
jgi:hypothetical protein